MSLLLLHLFIDDLKGHFEAESMHVILAGQPRCDRIHDGQVSVSCNVRMSEDQDEQTVDNEANHDAKVARSCRTTIQ